MFGFEILHFRSIRDTFKCVESIESKFDLSPYHICIVDNHSNDGSGQELSKFYCNDSHVTVIINNENLGFARGNNVGIEYLWNKFQCDFICAMNSDTYLIDNHFGKSICEEFEKSRFFVLGPHIITPDGKAVNPMGKHVLSYQETLKKIRSLKFQLFLNAFNLDSIARKAKMLITAKHQEDISIDKRIEDVKLHGSCLIFSKEYLAQYKGFFDKTFLYLEEDILYYIMMREGKKTVYSPNVSIFHKEDGSTDKLATGRKKRKFVLENHLHSMMVISDYIQQQERDVH